MKETFLDISINNIQKRAEFIKIIKYRDSKRYIAFILENQDYFIKNNLSVVESDAYPAILFLKEINYFAIEEAILNQPDLLEGMSESDIEYIIGNEWKRPQMLKNVDLQEIFDKNDVQGCTDIKSVIRAI